MTEDRCQMSDASVIRHLSSDIRPFDIYWWNMAAVRVLRSAETIALYSSPGL